MHVLGANSLAATAHSARLTLVIYMGVSGAQRIQDELLSGLPAHTPVAVIQSASLASQRHAVTKLGDLHAMVLREQLASPSVIVVGDVLQGLLALQQPIQQPHQTPHTRRPARCHTTPLRLRSG